MKDDLNDSCFAMQNRSRGVYSLGRYESPQKLTRWLESLPESLQCEAQGSQIVVY